jgi:hypothetical protein
MLAYMTVITDTMLKIIEAVGQWLSYAGGKLTSDPLWMAGAGAILGFLVLMFVLKKRVSD